MPRHYAPELRRRVIELIEGGRSVAEVAAMVEPTEQTIYNWWNQHQSTPAEKPARPRSRTTNSRPDRCIDPLRTQPFSDG